MKQILHKAKRKNWKTPSKTQQWIDGFYCCKQETTYCFKEDYEKFPVATHHFIIRDEMTDWGLPNEFRAYEIDPNTVCEFTGMIDKSKKQIWENDIVMIHNGKDYFANTIFEGIDTFVVVYNQGSFVLRPKNFESSNISWAIGKIYQKDIEVIGNVFDNDNLLKEKENE